MVGKDLLSNFVKCIYHPLSGGGYQVFFSWANLLGRMYVKEENLIPLTKSEGLLKLENVVEVDEGGNLFRADVEKFKGRGFERFYFLKNQLITGFEKNLFSQN
ncbi:hypothetical protein B6U91_02035 [Candidatus Pacearchaeota archaeon ex4484_71]|nr:MAG: hypothetical protein B6U91_02035 [Candidatus Pacearchaeota archaeon ex4484_71]